jgi:hypothetical protein
MLPTRIGKAPRQNRNAYTIPSFAEGDTKVPAPLQPLVPQSEMQGYPRPRNNRLIYTRGCNEALSVENSVAKKLVSKAHTKIVLSHLIFASDTETAVKLNS